MSSVKQRLARSGAGASRTARLRGEAKFRPNAALTDDKESPGTRSLRRPDSAILNESIPLFAIGRNKGGLWVARDCDGSAEDVFLSKAAAIRFAKRIRGPGACALMFVANGLELGESASQGDAWHRAVKAKVAALVATVKLWMGNLLRQGKRGNEQEYLIETGLYRNQYRYRSKSDDDLPIVR
jgi:hypothetical protein